MYDLPKICKQGLALTIIATSDRILLLEDSRQQWNSNKLWQRAAALMKTAPSSKLALRGKLQILYGPRDKYLVVFSRLSMDENKAKKIAVAI